MFRSPLFYYVYNRFFSRILLNILKIKKYRKLILDYRNSVSSFCTHLSPVLINYYRLSLNLNCFLYQIVVYVASRPEYVTITQVHSVSPGR